ncbi:CBO0543 family protein [Neobacillus sp. D3-1R]|uniref:CBO0543 family protein n=1 Tax=Neobacillus sp. D3-1R TaxID=3445778 RepID=UPI003FA00316
MYLLIVMVVYILFAKVFIDWKRWKEFYPTVQYYIICNLLYNFIFYQHTLWRYKAVTVSWLNHTIIEIAFSLFILPVVIMMYLQYFPKGRKKYFYIGIWVAYFSVIEWIFTKKGLFVYENGWNGWWSLLFNVISFVIIRLHYKRPAFAMMISIPIIIILLYFFHPALHELK